MPNGADMRRADGRRAEQPRAEQTRAEQPRAEQPRADLRAAQAEAARCLAHALPRRWAHVRAVGHIAEQLVAEGVAPPVVAVAAWLHDVGYSPVARDTGFHALDGARYLRRHGWPDDVVNLVAHHTGARFEAAERGLEDALRAFPEPDPAALDALSLADLTTSPAGLPTTVDDRLREILTRYGAADPVHRAVTRAEPHLRASVIRAAAAARFSR